jgi:hypothetical protein
MLRHLADVHESVTGRAGKTLADDLQALVLVDSLPDITTYLPAQMQQVSYLASPVLGFKCLYCRWYSKNPQAPPRHTIIGCSDAARQAKARGDTVVEQCWLQQFNNTGTVIYVEVFGDTLMDIDVAPILEPEDRSGMDEGLQALLGRLDAEEKATGAERLSLGLTVPPIEQQGELPPFLVHSRTSVALPQLPP